MRNNLANLAEARVREAEARVRDIIAEDEGLAREIQTHNAARETLAGSEIQINERHLETLRKKRKSLIQNLENAKAKLVQMNAEWVQALREQKVTERVQARRMREWQRDENNSRPKSVDELTLSPILRSRES